MFYCRIDIQAPLRLPKFTHTNFNISFIIKLIAVGVLSKQTTILGDINANYFNKNDHKNDHSCLATNC